MLVIFSKLEIEERDRVWIEAVRQAHDPQHRLIAPHVTFVFPFDGLPADDVLAHSTEVARRTPPIPFRLSRAAAVRDPIGGGSHLFLLPGGGEAAMHALHDRLYSGLLAAKLHPTIAYAPHVTVGAFVHHADAERTCADVEAFDIAGQLDAIVVADFDGTRLAELDALPLGG